MKFKRFLSLTLSVLLVLGAVPAASLFVGAASATYDITAAFGKTGVTVNGDTKSAADVFELKTMTADGIAYYAYDDGKTIADFISDGSNGSAVGLSVPYSVAANATTETAAKVNFVKLKDDVVTGRQLQSYYVDFDATIWQVNRSSGGLGLAFAFDSGTNGYKLAQFSYHTGNRAMQKNIYSVANGSYTLGTNGWDQKNIADADVLTSGTTYCYRTNFAYTYGSDGKVSMVTATFNIYASDEDRTNGVNAVATNTASVKPDQYTFTADMTPCFAFVAGTTGTNTIKNVVINYSKTAEDEENEAVENFKTQVANLTKDDLSGLNSALETYESFSDTVKENLTAEYAKICELLDGHFINGNTVTYSMTDADKEAYPYVYDYFKNTVMTTDGIEGATAKHVDFDKFNSRRMKSVTVAFKNDSEIYTSGKTKFGFGFIPEDITAPDGITAPANAPFALATNIQKYINTTSATPHLWFFKGNWNSVYTVENKTGSNTTLITQTQGAASIMNNLNWMTTKLNSNLKTQDADGNYTNLEAVTNAAYKIKGDRIVFKIDFETNLTTTTSGHSAVRVTPTSYQCFIDNNNNNTFDDDEFMITEFTLSNTNGILYKYANAEAPLPYIQLWGDNAIDNLLYFSTESEESFKDKYADVLNGTDASVDDVLAMYAAYNELSDSDKVIENVEDAVESAVTNADLRPETNGATLQANGTMNMAFYGNAPKATTESKLNNAYVSKFGIVLAGYQNMVDAGVKELTLKTADSIEKHVSYSADDTVDEDIRLSINGIDVTSTTSWKTKIVARVFVEYTVDGKTVPVYSVNADNGVAKPSTANGIDQNGVCIRNVNGILKAMAKELYKYSTDDKLGAIEGKAVNDDTAYEGKKLSENTEMLAKINPESFTAGQQEVFTFLCAYYDVFCAAASNAQ